MKIAELLQGLQIPLLVRVIRTRIDEQKVDILTFNWFVILGVLFFTTLFFYCWGALYFAWFTHSLDSFSQYPWFIIQVVSEGNSQSQTVLLITCLVSLVFVAVMAGNFMRNRALDKVYGDAHFASEREIRLSGLRARKGVVLGKNKGRYLFLEGDGHVLVYWPTGSGKGVGIVIPNLLNWPDSVICQDIKGENFRKTSGFRARHGQQIVLLDFMNVKSLRYNPLYYVRRDRVNRIGDIQRIYFILYRREFDKGEPWNPEARALFLAITLFLMDIYPDSVTIGDVVRVVKANDDFRRFIMATLHDYGTRLDPKCVDNFTSFLQKPAKEASSVVTQLKSILELWDNPIVDAVTSGNDFDLRDTRKTPMSIYVKVPPGDIDIVSPLLNLFYQQYIDLMTRKEPEADEPLQVLLLLDEFTAAGKLSIMESSIAFLRSYKLKFMPIIQGPSQMEIYGREGARNFTANFAVQSIAAQNDMLSAKVVSDSLGQKTVKVESRSRKGHEFKSGLSVSSSRIGRPLMSPDEVRRMNRRKNIILKEGEPPVMAKKIRYYFNVKMLLRTLIPPADIPELDVESHRRMAEDTKKRYIIDPDHPALEDVAWDELGEHSR